MKYLLLLALTTTVIAVSLTGCTENYHDIYREHYIYKPLPQPDTAAPAHLSPALSAPTES